MEQFTPETTQQVKTKNKVTSSSSFSYAKVYLWMTLGLVITGLVAFFLPSLLTLMATQFSWSSETLGNVYLGLLIASAVLMLPAMFLITFKAWQPKSALMTASYVIYTFLMGILLSSVFLTVLATSDSYGDYISTIGVSFLISAFSFFVMGLIGLFSKRNLGVLLPLLITLCLGSLTISLVNVFLRSPMIYWIIDFVSFAIILIVTAIDMNRMKQLAENGGLSSETNIALYCAFNLYVDFINIFLRVLYYVMASKNRK